MRASYIEIETVQTFCKKIIQAHFQAAVESVITWREIEHQMQARQQDNRRKPL